MSRSTPNTLSYASNIMRPLTYPNGRDATPIMATIVAIDDTPYNLDILKHGLEDDGHSVHIAESGEKGLRLIEETQPDLVLLDISMPVMDGHEVLQQLRLSDEFGDLPVIMVTANADDRNLARCLEAGANDYVTKPFSFTALNARINNVLRTAIAQRKLSRDVRELRSIAYKDSLTGLLNRGAFMERAMEEFSLAKRSGEPLSVAVLDLDHFKQINDRHGHPVGDEVLRQFSGLLRQSLRLHDLVGRIGGEEFAICMANTRRMQAYSIIERLRYKLAALRMPVGEGAETLSFSFSAGIVELEDQRSLDSLLILGDMALYRAKKQGRNRSIVETGVSKP